MTRSLFGVASPDWVVTKRLNGAIYVASGVQGTFWDAKVGGTQHDDLLIGTDAATSVTATDGQYQVYGPDDVTWMWADFGGERELVVAWPELLAQILDAAGDVAGALATILAFGNTQNAMVAGFINGAGATKDALNAALVGRASSPRDTQRVKVERKPVLALDQRFPNRYVDHKIVWVLGDSILYGMGKDDSLRTSNDSGVTWSSKLSYAGGLGQWAKYGFFYRLANGYLLTTYHPYDGSAPKIQRSIDGGGVWADVVAAQTNVDYLGPTSICQDPVSGYVYITEYVTASAATKATWKISRSTDNGATWSAFHTFQRDATANPTTAVRHGHGIQWDPVDSRIYFMCGDGEQAAGLYRLNSGGTDVEAVVTNSMVSMDTGVSPDLVSVMFFPNYIAWGVDRVSDSHLVRMARTQIGQPAPVVEQIARLQSTGFYSIRVASDNTEWILTVSNENGGGGRVDNLTHFYRVADDGATIDEVMSESVASATGFYWGTPIGDPLHTHTQGNLFWIGSLNPSLANKAPGFGGWQASARLGWSSGPPQLNPSADGKPFYNEIYVNSGRVVLDVNEKRIFGVHEVPPRTTKLYVHDANRETWSGDGFVIVEVMTYTMGALNQTLGTGLALAASGDTVTKSAHGLTNDTPVRLSSIVSATGVSPSVNYYVVGATTNTFQLALTPGGAAVDITADGTATVKYDPPPVLTYLKMEDGTTDMWWQNRSRVAALNENTAPYLCRSAAISPGTKIAFRVQNQGGTAPTTATVGLRVSFGF